MVENLPAIQETQVQCLRQEDPLEKEMATHFSILAWRIPWTEEPGGLQSNRVAEVTEEKGISSGDGFVRSCLDLLLKSPDSQCEPERVVWSKALLPKSGVSPAASATWEPL